MLRTIARSCLHAHTMRIETALWQEHTSECDRCDQGGLQNEKHAVFLCSCDPVCSLTRTLAHLSSDFPSTHRVFPSKSGTLHYTEASSKDVFHSLQKETSEKGLQGEKASVKTFDC
eukprot:727000-Pelagomonas_calceolata.AAC.1